jgi:hypothetical protein
MLGALVILVGLLLQEGAPAPAPEPAKPKEPAEAPPPAAKVVAAVAKAARENAALPEKERLSGDALGDHYVRRAAAAAEGDAAAFLVGIAHALDRKATLARNPLTAPSFRGLESEEEAKARKDSLGKPALRAREDLLVHFACSAAAALLVGPGPAEAAGIAKEIADRRPGGTGFSFADLLADLAGIRFAAWVKADPKARLERLGKEFRGADFCPDPSKEPEGLDEEAFDKEYGSIKDDRFKAKLKALRDAVAALAIHNEAGAAEPK